jgi:hypothetical protein
MASLKQRLNELVKLCKHLGENEKKIMREFYSISDKALTRITALEEEIRSLRQSDLFKPPAIFDQGQTMSKSFVSAINKVDLEPRWKRLKELIDSPTASSDELQKWLKWGKYKTIGEARKAIAQFELEEKQNEKV